MSGCGTPDDKQSVQPRAATVERVVDGDTLIVRDGDRAERVRLLGIDTPERGHDGSSGECGAARATANLRALAPAGAAIALTTEPASGDVRDRYGRLLALAAVGGRDLGLAQLRGGWAEVYAYRNRDFTRRGEYERAFETARAGRAGAHRVCGSDFHRSP